MASRPQHVVFLLLVLSSDNLMTITQTGVSDSLNVVFFLFWNIEYDRFSYQFWIFQPNPHFSIPAVTQCLPASLHGAPEIRTEDLLFLLTQQKEEVLEVWPQVDLC